MLLGLISNIITIIDATKQIYDATNEETGLPNNAFRQAGTRIPLVQDILQETLKYIEKNDLDEWDCETLVEVLNVCAGKANSMMQLFRIVIPNSGTSQTEQYRKSAQTRGVALMKRILEDMLVLASVDGISSITGSKVLNIKNAVAELSQVPPSITEQESSSTDIPEESTIPITQIQGRDTTEHDSTHERGDGRDISKEAWAIFDVPLGTDREQVDLGMNIAAMTNRRALHDVRRVNSSLACSSEARRLTTTRSVWTELPKDLVERESIEILGYTYEETAHFFYVLQYLERVSPPDPKSASSFTK